MSLFGKIAFLPFRILVWIVKIVLAVVLLAALAVAAVNVVVVGSTSGKIVSAESAVTSRADAIVVLGASVLPDGTPSTMLQDRLDDALRLYKLGVAREIIVSGDNTEEHYCESVAMKNYLVNAGVPSDAIVCDYAGYSTYDTVYRARYVFGCSSIVVCTQEYHLARAIFDAQGVGLSAIGVAADAGHTYDNQSYYDIREVFSRVKDTWLIVTGTTSSLSNELESTARSANESTNLGVVASNIEAAASNLATATAS